MVKSGQILARMDMRFSEADRQALRTSSRPRSLQLRRIDAELAGTSLARQPGDPPALFAQVDAQFRARRQAYLDSLETEKTILAKAEQDLRSAKEIESKLRKQLPIYREQEKAFEKLAKEGYAGRLMYTDKQRERIEKEQDLQAQEFTIAQPHPRRSSSRTQAHRADHRRLPPATAERARGRRRRSSRRLQQELGEARSTGTSCSSCAPRRTEW